MELLLPFVLAPIGMMRSRFILFVISLRCEELEMTAEENDFFFLSQFLEG